MLSNLYSSAIFAVVLGAIYVMVTLGYVVVYRASKVFNFAHPEFMLVGALAFTTFYGTARGIGLFAGALLASMVLTAVIGAGVYWVTIRRLGGQPHWVQMILTLGVSILMLNVAEMIWGTGTRNVALPFASHVFSVGAGVHLTITDLTVVVSCLVLGIGLYYLLTKSPIGTRLNATAENPVLAASCGIRVERWLGLSWAIAAAAAVIGGVAYSLEVPLTPGLTDVGLLVFPAAMIGGVDSISGAIVGAFLLAFIQELTTTFWNQDAATGVCFLVALLFLVVKPQGLFGRREVERV
jgi:branched-chain amino acid transport system permease protein